MIMEILLYFEAMPTLHKALWLAAVLLLCWLLEYGFPLVRLTYRKWRHAGANFVYLGLTSSINLLLAPAIVLTAQWTATHEFGLLHLVTWPTWLELLVAIALFDLFAQYVAHVLLHKAPILFLFHRVHHSDTAVDATTATRLHPVDFLVREALSLFVLVITGAPAMYYVLYRMVTILFSYTTHANFQYPRWIDHTLGWILITPNMHKFHHHDEMPWTDTNFGNIFSFWDRLFRTLVVDDPHKVRYGLDIMDDAKADDVLYQLKSPFDRNIQSAAERHAGHLDDGANRG